jgi:hypothetical protein
MKPKLKWLGRNTVLAPCLVLCTSQAEYRAVLEYLKVESGHLWLPADSGAATHTFESPTGDLTCVVCMELSFENPAYKAAMLAHEAVHVKQSLMESIGETNPLERIRGLHRAENLPRTIHRICS